jgi:NAD(P)-dependent dehydrogenase (short-subunit alcohol dehydrogenase family)
MELNMSTFTGCKTFTEKLKADVKSIDYVLLNAGILNIEHKSSIEGWEETLQVNVLSTALVALLLLPWIKEAGKGKAHLGFVTSGTHTSVDIGGDFPKENVLEYFNQKENWPTKGRGMYGLSKLLEMYVVAEISKLALGPDGSPQVIVNPMCPGLCKSDLGREYSNKGFLYSVGVNTFMTAVAKTTEGGARTYVLAALTTTAENGKYVRHYMTEEEYKAFAVKNITGPEGQKIQAEVWKEVLAVLEEKVPEVKDIARCTST